MSENDLDPSDPGALCEICRGCHGYSVRSGDGTCRYFRPKDDREERFEEIKDYIERHRNSWDKDRLFGGGLEAEHLRHIVGMFGVEVYCCAQMTDMIEMGAFFVWEEKIDPDNIGSPYHKVVSMKTEAGNYLIKACPFCGSDNAVVV